MPQPSTHVPAVLSLDQGGESWSLLSGLVHRFIETWDKAIAGEVVAPEPSEYLTDDVTAVLQQELLVELLKVDLEYRWTNNYLPRAIEDYLVDFPQLRGQVPTDLVLEEVLQRHRAGEAVDLQEYCTRYPECAASLEKLWQQEQSASRGAGGSRSRKLLETFQPGDTVDDFDLLTLLGTGAFARVFLARQRSMQRLVALKLSTDHSREPQTLAQLDHDHIVRVYDQRSVEGQGLRLLYMQYVPGGTLQSVVPLVRKSAWPDRTATLLVRAVRESLDSRGEADRLTSAWAESSARIPWPDAVCRMGIQLARALHYAHGQGVLHRDIKPANVLLAGDGSPKLADFNISFSSRTAGATPAAYFGGSLAYMSPEQLEASHPNHSRQAEDLDGRSDLFSLGVVLWELLYGGRPFVDEAVEDNWTLTVEKMISRRRTGVNYPLPKASECPARATALSGILQRCLSSEPPQRFQSGAELARHLELCLDSRAWSLVTEVDDGWRGYVRRFPLLFALAGVLAPNIAATIFNIWYNEKIVPREARDAFWMTLTAVNSVAYPIGIWLALDSVKGVFPAIRKHRVGNALLRRRSLLSGVKTGGICLTLWTLAGFVYPVVLHRFSQEFPWTLYIHLLVSLTLCGLVSAVYPFFAVTWLGVKVFYPALLDLSDDTLREDEVVLSSVRQWCEAGMLLAAAVPLVAVTVLVGIDSPVRGALFAASAGGLFGFVATFPAFRELREDLATLIRVVRGEAAN